MAELDVEPLTERQREVLDLIARGYTNPQIADALGVSIDGAKWHVREILSKLGVESREEAAEWWRQERSVGTRVRRAVRAGVGFGVLRWVAGGAVVALVGALAVVAVLAGRGDGPEVESAVGVETVRSECGIGIAPWLCEAASGLSGEVEHRQFFALTERGTPTVYTCGEGVLSQAEYSYLCQGASAGDQRDGYPVSIHGSHGGPMDWQELSKQLSTWFGLDGERIRPMVSIGCPVDDAECRSFVVVFPLDPEGLRVVYLAFAGGPTVRPSLIGAGASGDNADTILNGGETRSVIGMTRFIRVDTARIVAARTPTTVPTPAPTVQAQPHGTRTGIGDLDTVISAALNPDAILLSLLIEYMDYPCPSVPATQPEPYTCRGGERIGEVMRGLWVSEVEGGLWAPSEAPQALFRALTDNPVRLYAVYRRTRPESASVPQGEFGIVLSADLPQGPWYVTLNVRLGKIVSVQFTFPEVEVFEDPTTDWVIAPLAPLQWGD